MSCNVNVSGLQKASEVQPGSFFVVETDSGTQILDFKNLNLGLDNVSFASVISANAANIATNYTLIQQLTSTITQVVQEKILGVQWKGDWNSATAYVKNDMVYYSPASATYMADLDVPVGNLPTNTYYWDRIALNVDYQLPLSNKGDLLTHDGGYDLTVLSAGDAGSFLKSQGSGNDLVWQKSPGGRSGSTCKKLSTGLTAGNNYYPGEVLLYLMDNNTIKSIGRNAKYGTAYGRLNYSGGQVYNIPQVAGIDKYFDRAVDVIKDVYQVGSEVTFFITEAGDVWGVGRNDGTPGGYLGTGDTTLRYIFERNAYFYNNNIKIVDIAKNDGWGPYEGNYATVHFLTSAGNVYSTGYNGHGELGNSNTTSSTTPVKASGLGPPDTDPVVKLFSGGHHSTVFAVTDKGDTYGWGYNTHGQLGNASTTNQQAPSLLSPTYIPKGVVDVKTWQGYNVDGSGAQSNTFYSASMALLSSGEMYFTGHSRYGLAGTNVGTEDRTTWHQLSAKTDMGKLTQSSNGIYSDITDVTLLTNIKQFDVTTGTTAPTVVAVTYDGQVYTWGYGYYGQLCMYDVALSASNDGYMPVNITQSLSSSLDGSDIRNKVSKVLCARHTPTYSAAANNGWGTTYFQDTDGQLYGCGNNDFSSIPGQGNQTATGGRLVKIPLPCLPSEVADWKVVQLSDPPAGGNSDQYKANNLLILSTDGSVYIAGDGNGRAAFGVGGINYNVDTDDNSSRAYWQQVAF